MNKTANKSVEYSVEVTEVDLQSVTSPRYRIGMRLRELRQEAQMTQTSVAREMNISNSALSQYEASKRVPDYDLLCKLARLYDVSTDYLLGLTDFRLRFDDINAARIEMQGIQCLRNRAPELFITLAGCCDVLDDCQLNALSKVVGAYVRHFKEENAEVVRNDGVTLN